MPIYAFRCRACDEDFDVFVRKQGDEVSCSACGSTEVERTLTAPTVRSRSTRDQSMRAAKKRDKKQAYERMNEQRLYELSHND